MYSQTITPEPGKTYTLKAAHSMVTSTFLCLSGRYGEAVLQNQTSGWIFKAHHIRQYDDGEIDWSYSTDGHFENVPEPNTDPVLQLLFEAERSYPCGRQTL